MEKKNMTNHYNCSSDKYHEVTWLITVDDLITSCSRIGVYMSCSTVGDLIMACNSKRTTSCSGVDVSCSRTGSVYIPCSRVLVLLINYSDFPHYTFRLPYFFTLISYSVFLAMLFIMIVIFIFPFSILSLFSNFMSVSSLLFSSLL